jgi:hypothetical protein
VELKLYGILELLAYADGVNLLGDNIDTSKKTKILINTVTEVGLEVNTDKTTCCWLVTRMQVKTITQIWQT